MSNSSFPNLGKYQISEEIGRGGMGAVYKGYDPLLDRTVAVKILAPHLVWEQAFLERFLREARAAARLQHPNIIPVHDVGQEGDNYYFVMAYLPGPSLKQLIAQKGRLAPAEALSILRQLASALDYAHSKGLIHRDVKPANVMFNEQGQAVLTDFGIVKAAAESRLTGTGASIGTPHYMAPEQVMSQEVDARTDEYALGIIAFEMLTGRVPFDGDTTTAVLFKQVNEPPPSILACCPDLPPAVEPALKRALNKSPADRYASCEEFVRALEQAFAQSVEPQPTLQPASLPIEHAPRYGEVLIESKREQPILPAMAPLAPTTLTAAPPAQVLSTAPAVPLASQRDLPGWRERVEKLARPLEMMLLSLSSLACLVGLLGAICSLIPSSDPNRFSWQFLPACASPALAGAGGIVMLWLRRRVKMGWAPLLIALLPWSIGAVILSGGVTATFLYKDPSEFASNLGWAAVVGLVPGAFLALVGVAVYGYSYSRSRRAQATAEASIVDMPVGELSRADKLAHAAEYRAYIADLIKRRQRPAFAHQITPIVSKLDQWLARLRQLAERLDAFEANQVIQRDIKDVPGTVARFATELETETDTQARAQMQDALARYREHQSQLDALVKLMHRTELEIDKTLASMASIYSRLQLLGAKEIDSNRANRLKTDIEEQVNLLGDILSALDDVYRNSSGPSGKTVG